MTYTVDDFVEACQSAIDNGYKIKGGEFVTEFYLTCCPLIAMMMKNMNASSLMEVRDVICGEEFESRMEEILNMSFDEIHSFWSLFDNQCFVYNFPPASMMEDGLGKEVYYKLKEMGML